MIDILVSMIYDTMFSHFKQLKFYSANVIVLWEDIKMIIVLKPNTTEKI